MRVVQETDAHGDVRYRWANEEASGEAPASIPAVSRGSRTPSFRSSLKNDKLPPTPKSRKKGASIVERDLDWFLEEDSLTPLAVSTETVKPISGSPILSRRSSKKEPETAGDGLSDTVSPEVKKQSKRSKKLEKTISSPSSPETQTGANNLSEPTTPELPKDSSTKETIFDNGPRERSEEPRTSFPKARKITAKPAASIMSENGSAASMKAAAKVFQQKPASNLLADTFANMFSGKIGARQQNNNEDTSRSLSDMLAQCISLAKAKAKDNESFDTTGHQQVYELARVMGVDFGVGTGSERRGSMESQEQRMDSPSREDSLVMGTGEREKAKMSSMRTLRRIARSPFLFAKYLNSPSNFMDLVLGTSLDMVMYVEDEAQLADKVLVLGSSLLQATDASFFTLHDDILFDNQTFQHYDMIGIVGLVANTGEPFITEDPEESDFYCPVIDSPASAYLCIPVVIKGETVAVIRVIRKGNAPPFSKTDENLADCLAHTVAVCMRYIARKKDVEFSQKKSDVMVEVARNLTEKVCDSNATVRTIIDYARTVCGAERCRLYVVDQQQQCLLEHLDDEIVEWSISEGVAGQVAQTGKTINLANVQGCKFFSRKMEDSTKNPTKSMLTMSVVHEDEIVAIAQLINKTSKDARENKFTDTDEQTLSGFTRYAAAALTNSNLYRAARTSEQKTRIMLQLAHSLATDVLDETKLISTVMEHARILTQADRCSLFIVAEETGELIAHLGEGTSIRMPKNAGIAGSVACSGEKVNIADVYTNPNFNKAIDLKTGYRTKSMLCMPVQYDGQVVAVAQLVNKLDKKGNIISFTSEDEQTFSNFAVYAGVSLRNCHMHVNLAKKQATVKTAMACLESLSQADIKDHDAIMESIMRQAKTLLSADRCTLLALDKERNELYFKSSDTINQDNVIRFPKSRGIAGEVATKGVLLNIKDAYQDSRFNQDIDVQLGYCTKALLTIPVFHKDQVVAVLQMVNKVDSETDYFTANDEELIRLFAVFAGISLANSNLYNWTLNSTKQALNLLNTGATPTATETIVDLQSISRTDIDFYSKILISEQEREALSTYKFNVLNYKGQSKEEEGKLIVMLYELFDSLGLIEKFNVNREAMMTFLIRVKSLYRGVPYHNFFHAFDVTQTLYVFIKTLEGTGLLSDLEKFVLLTAGTVHDVDHMGLNNSFYLKCDTPMGIISSASGTPSVLEVHHCNIAVQLLGMGESDIFAGLEEEDKKTAYKILVDVILATDMAHHAQLSAAFKEAYSGGGEVPQEMVLKMLMKSADLSNIFKPFEYAKQWAVAVTEEFFMQGDLEKKANVEVMHLHDREKNKNLAKSQLGFIDFLGTKHYSIMADWSPLLSFTIEGVQANREKWASMVKSDAAGLIA